MKIRSIFLGSVLILINGGILYSQSIDEILGKYYEAMGGLDRLRTIKSMKETGKYIVVEQGGWEMSMTIWYKAPNKSRTEWSFRDQKIVHAFDGETAWRIQTMSGITEPEPMCEEETNEIKNNADLYPLVDYKNKGHKLELLGKEVLDGIEVFKIKLTRKNGSEVIYFLDSKSGKELKNSHIMTRGEADHFIESISGNYRKVDWLLVPFSIEDRVDGNTFSKILWEKVEVNPEMNDSIFEMSPNKEEKVMLEKR
jgi:outer membrane lipoprotein-sorting protein